MSVLATTAPRDLELVERQATAISRALRKAARQARTPQPLVFGGGGIRARRGDRLFWAAIRISFLACVAAPILIAALFYGLIASDQFAAEMRFAVRTGEGSGLGSLGGLVGTVLSQQSQDTVIIENFIRSRAAIDDLGRTLDLRKVFSSAEADYFSSLDSDAPAEELEKYWKKQVSVSTDRSSGIVRVEVRAFTPADSMAIAEKILAASQNLVNDLASAPKRDKFQLAQVEYDRAEAQLRKATDAMRDRRNQEGVLDATASAEAIEKLLVPLQLELSRLEQEAVGQSGLSDDASAKRLIQKKIAALKAHIASYRQQIAGADAGDRSGTLATRLGALSRSELDLEIARQRYVEASALLETARIDLATRPAYLAVSQPPLLPEKAIYPKRWLGFALVCGIAFFAWLLVVGCASLVRDNMA